jgi:hypothetical protein
MSLRAPQPISGHVFRREGKRGAGWHAKYRLPDGRQGKARIGPAWTARGRPAEGFYTRRTPQAWLDQVLAEAMEYLQYAPRDGEADLIADAFAQPSLDPTASRDGA